MTFTFPEKTDCAFNAGLSGEWPASGEQGTPGRAFGGWAREDAPNTPLELVAFDGSPEVHAGDRSTRTVINSGGLWTMSGSLNQTFSDSFSWLVVGRGLAPWESDRLSERFNAFTLMMDCQKTFDASVRSAREVTAFDSHAMTGGGGASVGGNGVQAGGRVGLDTSDDTIARFGQPIAGGGSATVVELDHPDGTERWTGTQGGDYFALDGQGGRYDATVNRIAADSPPLLGLIGSFHVVQPSEALPNDAPSESSPPDP